VIYEQYFTNLKGKQWLTFNRIRTRVKWIQICKRNDTKLRVQIVKAYFIESYHIATVHMISLNITLNVNLE